MTIRVIAISALFVAAHSIVHPTSFGATMGYVESGGVVVGEGEIFSERIPRISDGKNWVIKPTENAGTTIGDGGPIISGARGGAYVQTLPDNLGNGTLNAPPEIHYLMQIDTPGTYQLYLRWDGNDTNGTTQGQSDSMFADIIELKDGAGGTIADWYEFQQGVNGNFASPAWDAGAGFEQNVAGPSNSPALWALTPGLYTLRFTSREDGAAVDAFVFQLSNLAAPTGNGPQISEFTQLVAVPEPTSVGIWISLGILAFSCTVWRSNRKTDS